MANGRILVVDDNLVNLDLLSRRLQRQGYEVATASGGRQALTILADEPFDLALLDIIMPEFSGLEVLGEVRKRHTLTDLPVIMVTAKDRSEDVVEALRLGANDYITKPIDLPVLLARVQTALQLRKLAALKDEFLRIASHDLKNPLNEVLMVASLLETMVPPGAVMSDAMHAKLGNLKKGARRMQGIIENFLDLQALEDGALKLAARPFDLAEVVRETAEAGSVQAQAKQLKVLSEAVETPCWALGDRDRAAQVARNLVDNAVKFSPPGAGPVELRLEAEAPAHWKLMVCDHGPGLTEADLAKVFEKYGKLSAAPTAGEKSFGLGLAICKRLIEGMGGRIGAGNQPQGGAVFWFVLPQSPEAISGESQNAVR